MTEPRYDYESMIDAIRAIPADAKHGYRAWEEPFDWAGLGFPHRLLCWTDANNVPRSYIVKP